MTSVYGIQGYGQKFESQLELLEAADIDEEDRTAIERFIRWEDAQDDVNTGTMVSHLNRLRLSAERADTALTAMELDDVNISLSRLKREFEFKEGSRRDYRKALRVFFRWRDVAWAEDIKIGASPDRSVDREDLLTDEEVNDMPEVGSNPRDKALIALLDDTGLRIGAIGSLRIKDVDLSGKIGYISINEDANVKDASGRKPLTYSRGQLANWLDVHPTPDEPEAPVIDKSEGWTGDDDSGAMTQQYLSRRVKMIAEDADLDGDRIHTHLFRKTTISRWIREDVHEQVIKSRVDWVKDSQQFETYSGVEDEQLNEQFLEHYDLAEPDESERTKLENCTVCGTPLRGTENVCPSCAAPLNESGRDAIERVESSARDSMVEEDDAEKRLTISEMADEIKENSSVSEGLLTELRAKSDD